MSLIHVGQFSGQWHGQSVSFDIQRLHPIRAFDGVTTFTGGPFRGQSFGFVGNSDSNGSLHMSRNIPEGVQIAAANPPQLDNGRFVWNGNTTGPGINGSLPFEFEIQGLIRLGSFSGQWHGQSVTFKVEGMHPNRAFDGVMTFTGGPFQGQSFGFAGNLDGDGSLHMNRNTGQGFQLGNAGPPTFSNGKFVWNGSTTGAGINGSLPFQLHL